MSLPIPEIWMLVLESQIVNLSLFYFYFYFLFYF